MKKDKKKIMYLERELERNRTNVFSLNMLNEVEGKKLVKYFKDFNFHTAAIYGMGAVGKKLYKMLQTEDVQVLYGIDKFQTESVIAGLEMKNMYMDILTEVDVVIVTPYHEFEYIRDTMMNYFSSRTKIISLKKIFDYVIE